MLLNLPKKVTDRTAKQLIRPHKVLEQLHIEPDWQILEIGQPVGAFTNSLHNLISDDGKIIVAASDDESLEKLNDELSHPHTTTTTLSDVLVGRAANAHSLDLIILTNLLSRFVSAQNFCLSLTQYLKPHGKVVIVDWDTQFTKTNKKDSIMNLESAIKLLSQCELAYDRTIIVEHISVGLVFNLKPS